MMSIYLALCLSATPKWQWPIDISNGVTATFGEYRGDHFHMGLDFSTGGQEGLEIRPASAGQVFRVRAQAHGYGKCVYIKHADGWVTVYAHLAGFGPLLSQAIQKLGYQPDAEFGTLNVDLAVNAQTLLAHSGESGAGLPHFHFELRDRNNRPVDPLGFGFPKLALQERLVLEAIWVLPLAADSTVNHGRLPAVVTEFPARIQAAGAVGFLVQASIRDRRGNTLAPRSLKVTSGDQTLIDWSPRRIAFDAYKQAGLVYDQARSGFGDTRYLYACDERANGPEFKTLLPLDVQNPVALRCRIEGIQTSLEEILELDPQASKVRLESGDEGPSVQATSLSLRGWSSRIHIEPQIAGTLAQPTAVTGLKAKVARSFVVEAGSAANAWAWRTEQGNLERIIGALPRQPEFTYPVGPYTLSLTGTETLPDQVVWLEPADPRIQMEALEYLSPVIRFGREGYPTPGLQLTFQTGRQQHVGAFAWSYSRKKWVFWSSEVTDQRIRVHLDYTVPMVIARDISPPTVGNLTRHGYFTGARTVLPINDLGSGVDWSSARLVRADQALTFQVDRDRRWLVLDPNTRPPFVLAVKDRSGNSLQLPINP